ncbi:MAG: CHASE4 domain-containing protein, partial [Planctomycetota bacterium]
MSLTTKIAAILTALILTLSVAGALMQHRAFSGIFSSLEQNEAAEDLGRVTRALDAEVDELARVTERYAAWDRTYHFVFDRQLRDGFARENIAPAMLRAQKLDLLYFCELDGTVAGGLVLHPETHEPIRLREYPGTKLSDRHPALAWFDKSLGINGVRPLGIMLTEERPLLVAASTVTGLDQEARPGGFVITGRFLGDDLAQRVQEQTQVDFDVWQLDREILPPDVLDIVDVITGSPAPVLREASDGSALLVHSTYDDIRGRPTLLVRASVDRDISAAGRAAVASGALTDAALGLTVLLALLFALNLIILRPIRALTDHAVRTGKAEDFGAKLGMDRSDEIGTLSREFDQMLANLEQARSALVETARTAGMSEIATGILHNVGNVLNSVNISASLVSQRIDGLCVDDLERLAEVLAENADDLPRFLTEDPRGQHIQPFLSALVVQLGEEQRTIRTEIESLANGIDHICELVKSQQDLAKGAKIVQSTDITERFDEALRITQRVHGIDPELVVRRRYDEAAELKLDKHKLLEILVNLVQNALQAMAGSDGPRELTLEILRHDDGSLALAVSDTGVGIPEEDLVKVFSMGFTTREEGHGFGLHSSANAAKEMGGRLYAESDGPGRGARFVLELPEHAPGVAAAAEDLDDVVVLDDNG